MARSHGDRHEGERSQAKKQRQLGCKHRTPFVQSAEQFEGAVAALRVIRILSWIGRELDPFLSSRDHMPLDFAHQCSVQSLMSGNLVTSAVFKNLKCPIVTPSSFNRRCPFAISVPSKF